jgi:caa(3)-type oxidase subunit IV
MSEDAAHRSPYRIYWITWVILLVITVAMLGAEKVHMPRWFLVLFLVAFMMVKATMIGGNFMHLRYEHKRMAFMVASGILLTSLILFIFISPESWHVRSLTSAPAPAPAPIGHGVE